MFHVTWTDGDLPCHFALSHHRGLDVQAVLGASLMMQSNVFCSSPQPFPVGLRPSRPRRRSQPVRGGDSKAESPRAKQQTADRQHMSAYNARGLRSTVKITTLGSYRHPSSSFHIVSYGFVWFHADSCSFPAGGLVLCILAATSTPCASRRWALGFRGLRKE